MDTITYKEAPFQPNSHGVEVRNLLNNSKIQILHITLKPGESLPKHSMSMDAVFYVLEGNGTVSIGNEEKGVIPDTLIPSPSELERGWLNTGDKPLRILVTKMLV